MTDTERIIPNGKAHIALIYQAGIKARSKTFPLLIQKSDYLNVIGISFSVLYQAATCHRMCHGGCHMLERLCGRAYNLGCSAFQLSILGYYDESLCLIRGLGELSNLITLFAVDPQSLQEWITSSKETRRRKFLPVHVRERLEKNGTDLVYATKHWYGDLSESYIHITPDTRPNNHNGQPWVGSFYQEEGVTKVLNELVTVLCELALGMCHFFKFDDLLKELVREINKYSDR